MAEAVGPSEKHGAQHWKDTACFEKPSRYQLSESCGKWEILEGFEEGGGEGRREGWKQGGREDENDQTPER